MTELKREIRPIDSKGEWLRWRQGLVTASSIGCLFDCHPYYTLADLVAEKRGERRGQGDTPAMRAGRILEPGVIAALNEERPDLRVVKANEFYVLPELKLGATPDAFGEDGALLVQLKTASREQWDKWHGTLPLAYTLQTLCEMMVTGCERGILAVLLRSPSYPLYTFAIKRHPAAEQRIIDAVRLFWAKWDAGEHPEPQSAEGMAEALDDGTSIDLSADNQIRELLEERAMRHESANAEDARIKEIDTLIKAKIGAAARAYVPGWAISFKAQTRKETILPERTFRTLRIRRSREEEKEDDE